MKSFFVFILIIFFVSIIAAENITFMGKEKNNSYNFDLEFQKALSHYPELENVSVKVVGKSYSGRIAKSRPKLNFLFNKKEKREYLIIINNDYSKNSGYLFDSLSEKSRTGLLGHELAHILDYENKSKFQIIGFGFSYLFLEKRKQIERRIDNLTIEHGLGEEIYEFTKQVLEDKKSSQKYKDYRKKTYYLPSEIKNLNKKIS